MQVSDLINSVTRFEGLELIGKLAEGPLGDLYLVQERETGKRYGLKFISPTVTGSMPLTGLVDAITDAKGLVHPNVGATYSIGVFGGHAYVIREYVTGTSLEPSLQKPLLSLKEVLNIATQSAKALAAVHQKGLTHYDIKPGNIILSELKTVKLVDLGIGGFKRRFECEVTHPSAEEVLAYMAPEQVKRKEIGNQDTDVYSLGKVIKAISSPKTFATYERRSSAISAILDRFKGERHLPVEQQIEERAAKRFGKVLDEMLAYRAVRRPSAEQVVRELTEISNDLLSRESEAFQSAHRLGSRAVGEEQSPTRKINVWLVDAESPLFAGKAHTIGINIGNAREGTLTKAAFNEPDWGDYDQLDLIILLESLNASVSPGWHPAVLPKDKDMDPVYFQVTAQGKGPVLLLVSIFLARELALLEKLSIEVTAVEKVMETAA